MIHETAFVKSSIPDSCVIHPYAIIGENVHMGENVVIYSFVVISDNVHIGDNVEIFPGAYVGKEPKGPGVLARKPEFNKALSLGNNCSIGPHAVIYYDVSIGQNTLIGDGASIREQSVIGDFVVIGRHVTINYKVKVGDRTKVMDHVWLAGNMDIGANVFISGGVLTANDNHLGDQEYQEDNTVGPYVGDGAKVGVGAILLPNVVVGARALVAAGSVVTKNVLSGTKVKGIPARAFE